jgi:SpoVK/Ycf46/Vps4 family AAA+-type ATPase
VSDEIDALRAALAVSPDNLPLRQHVAATLIAKGRFAEAEEELKQALRLAPGSAAVKLDLARAYLEQKKDGAAVVVLEELERTRSATAEARLLLARALLRQGEPGRAGRIYREIVELEPELKSPALEQELGLAPGVAPAPAEAALETETDETVPSERPRVTFADVGGMGAVKDEIRMKIVLPRKHPEMFKAYGKTAGGGILLYGPPGCGKTHLARATAGEIEASFLAIGIDEVLDMWIGSSEKNLHAIFEQARAKKPCVIFFDEVDALAANRSDMRSGSARQVINQFLSELDGAKASNEGVLVLAATNAPWHLDPAFRRPGRFDKILFVPPPDAPAREAILTVLLRDRPTQGVDVRAVAKTTESFSGADLKAAVDAAVEKKLREALRDGIPRPLTTKDLVQAAATIRPSTREWFQTAKNYALYANQGGIYDDLLNYVRP